MAHRFEYGVEDPVLIEGVLRAVSKRTGYQLAIREESFESAGTLSVPGPLLVQARVIELVGPEGPEGELRIEQRVFCSRHREERGRCDRLVVVVPDARSPQLDECLHALFAVEGAVERPEESPIGAGMDAGRFAGRIVARAAREVLELLPRIEREAEAPAILDGWDAADHLGQAARLFSKLHPELIAVTEALDPIFSVLDTLRLLGLQLERLAFWRADLPDHDEAERDAVGLRIRARYERVREHLYASLRGEEGRELRALLEEVAAGSLDRERGCRLGPYAAYALHRGMDAYRQSTSLESPELDRVLRAIQGISAVVSILGPGLPLLVQRLSRPTVALRERIRRVHDSARAVRQLRWMAHAGDFGHKEGVFLLGVLAERHASRGRSGLRRLDGSIRRVADRFVGVNWWVDDPPEADVSVDVRSSIAEMPLASPDVEPDASLMREVPDHGADDAAHLAESPPSEDSGSPSEEVDAPSGDSETETSAAARDISVRPLVGTGRNGRARLEASSGSVPLRGDEDSGSDSAVA